MVRIGGDNVGAKMPMPSSEGPQGTPSFDRLQSKKTRLESSESLASPQGFLDSMGKWKGELERIVKIMGSQIDNYTERDWDVMIQEVSRARERMRCIAERMYPGYEGIENIKRGLDELEKLEEKAIGSLVKDPSARAKFADGILSILKGEFKDITSPKLSSEEGTNYIEGRNGMKDTTIALRAKYEALFADIGKNWDKNNWNQIKNQLFDLRGELFDELKKYGDTRETQIANGYGYLTTFLDKIDKFREMISETAGKPDLDTQKKLFLTLFSCLSNLSAGPPESAFNPVEPPWIKR